MYLHWQQSRRPKTPEEMCKDIERLSEGLVACHIDDIEADPDSFPCCVKCGELECTDAPGFGVPDDEEPSEGDDEPCVRACGLVVQTARQLVTKHQGSAVELAAFQCAQEIRRGHECRVGIAYDADGMLHAFVVYPDGTTKEAALEAVTRNPCACGEEEGE